MKLFALVTALVVLVPAAAQAAAPAPATGGAKSITSTSALLTGSVNPNNEATTYHFEYGLTNKYGSTTPDQGPTAANKVKTNVSVGVSGLAAGTTYHYRLVATNASGTKAAGDKGKHQFVVLRTGGTAATTHGHTRTAKLPWSGPSTAATIRC